MGAKFMNHQIVFDTGAIPIVPFDKDRYRAVGFLRMVERVVRKHGPVLRLVLENGEEKILLASPEFADAWRRNTRNLVKDVDEFPAPASLARMILDNNLTTAREGEEWKTMRSQVAPLMRYKITSYAEAVDRAVSQMIENLKSTETEQSLWEICGTWSASTVCHPVLGVNFDEAMTLDMVNGLRETMFHLVTESADKDRSMLQQDKLLRRLRLRLESICADAIQRAKSTDETMVSILLADRNYTFGSTPDKSIVAELQPILIGALAAAVHNNSLAMFWLMTNIAKNPAIGQAIANEANAATFDHGTWSIKDSPKAMSAVRESLRLYPVLPFIERKADCDLDLAGVHIAKGDVVIFSPWMVHRDPAIWPEPQSFDPSRFETDRIDLTRWFPFGLGHRACIGSNLALSQLTRSISLICAKLQFSIPENIRPVEWQPSYRVLLEPRENGARLCALDRS